MSEKSPGTVPQAHTGSPIVCRPGGSLNVLVWFTFRQLETGVDGAGVSFCFVCVVVYVVFCCMCLYEFVCWLVGWL